MERDRQREGRERAKGETGNKCWEMNNREFRIKGIHDMSVSILQLHTFELISE